MMTNRRFKPESLMMSYGYKPELSEGAIKCPVFQTSSFKFKTAEEGKAYFELAYGLREKTELEDPGLIYSRLNNPDLEILEERLTLWDKAEECAVFDSGMSAISTALLETLGPGDCLLFSNPVYGGTSHFIQHILPKFGIQPVGFQAGMHEDEIMEILEKCGIAHRLSVIFIETPANPTNELVDIEACVRVARRYSTDEKRVLTIVDNTYLGPIWQHPLEFGADLVIYSATKYINGHSDAIAGASLGSHELIQRMKTLRTFLGNMADPWTSWLVMRSLETLKLRMDQQAANAAEVARYLADHDLVEKVLYLGLLSGKDGESYRVFKKQATSPGAMVSFTIRGGEQEAFEFLNSLKLIKLAVSLGSTESLAQHPATMTHAGLDPHEKSVCGITDNLIRLSIGVENIEDIKWDLDQALERLKIRTGRNPQESVSVLQF
jgi:methionine-gamma-lyase